MAPHESTGDTSQSPAEAPPSLREPREGHSLPAMGIILPTECHAEASKPFRKPPEGSRNLLKDPSDLIEGRVNLMKGRFDLIEGPMNLPEGQPDPLEDRMHLLEGPRDLLEGRLNLIECSGDLPKG